MEKKQLKSVLIIDDDPNIRMVIRSQLKASGYKLFEASNRKEAITLLESEAVNIVICDIKMKEENGFDILREIHPKYPELPVVMLTGYIEKEYYDTAKELGSIDMIIKPVRKEKLLEVLENALVS